MARSYPLSAVVGQEDIKEARPASSGCQPASVMPGTLYSRRLQCTLHRSTISSVRASPTLCRHGVLSVTASVLLGTIEALDIHFLVCVRVL